MSLNLISLIIILTHKFYSSFNLDLRDLLCIIFKHPVTQLYYYNVNKSTQIKVQVEHL